MLNQRWIQDFRLGGWARTGSWVLGAIPGFSCRFWGWTRDFHVGFRSRHKIFVCVLEADPGPVGAMYVGPPMCRTNRQSPLQ